MGWGLLVRPQKPPSQHSPLSGEGAAQRTFQLLSHQTTKDLYKRQPQVWALSRPVQ